MAAITAITPQRRRTDRVSVYLDGEFWTGMSASAVLDLGLYPGQAVDEPARQELEVEIGRSEALHYSMDRLAARPRSRHQLAAALRERRGYGEDVITECLRKCEELLLLDDEQFARDTAQTRKEAGQGPGKVRFYLERTAGVERTIVDDVIAEAFAEDEQEVAERALDQRMPGLLSRADQRRALALLLRRGFDSGVAGRAVSARAMSAEQQRETEDPEELARALRAKYGSLTDQRARQRAYGFLARRGISGDGIRAALRLLDES